LPFLPCIALTFAWSAPARADRKEHPAEKAGIKSVEAYVEVQVTFTNKGKRAVEVYLLASDGERRVEHTLKADESVDRHTYLTHPWLIADEDDAALALSFPDGQPRKIVIERARRNKSDVG
jgi:hypothetical protein